jgi:hypothetical protein
MCMYVSVCLATAVGARSSSGVAGAQSEDAGIDPSASEDVGTCTVKMQVRS